MCINEENVHDAINILKMPESTINMSSWQQYGAIIYSTLDRLHKCGTAACLGGHIAISPRFIDAGGTITGYGEPEYKELRGHFAIAKWFGISDDLAMDICGIGDNIGEGVYGESIGVHITKEMVIDVLENLLNGYYV